LVQKAIDDIGGPERTMQIIEELRDRKVFSKPEYYSRLKKGIKKASLRLGSPIPLRGELIKSRMQQYPNVDMPSVVGSNYPEYYPKECRNADFQVYVWEILTLKTNNRFKPLNNMNYK
jgi:hypothetical protein